MQKEILRVFEYFYFFSYPINFKTIKKYLGVKVNDKKLKKEVERLVKLKKITFKRNLYTLGEYSISGFQGRKKITEAKIKRIRRKKPTGRDTCGSKINRVKKVYICNKQQDDTNNR